jgi:hypothetical protein
MPTYFEIDVTLIDIKPKIWRRFHLRPDHDFGDLSDFIQFVGPWEQRHLWHFREWGRDGRIFAELKTPGSGEFDAWQDVPPANADQVPLTNVLKKKGDRCIYTYDMGDSWQHEIKLRNVFESDEKFTRRLVDGARRFPPEDCGGVYGYVTCLLAVGKLSPDEFKDPPSEEELAERREWLGDWDPEAFPLDVLKSQFDSPKPRKRTPR